ncbi:MAG: DUF1588 domain-containing protein [Archangiaceae bacterium]|nr:DUF1588 domain-containing protein [Archangiaceae bacterium]
MLSSRRAALIGVLALAACEGQIAAPDDTQPPGTPPPKGWVPGAPKPQFSCAPDAPAVAAVPLLRLSRVEYLNTVSDLVRRANPAEAAAVLGEVQAALSRVPPDSRVGAPGERRGGFAVADQSLQQALVDATYDVAVALGRSLTSSAARRKTLLGACATDTSTANDRACLESFVRDFGARAFRRPLDDAEVTALMAVALDAPVAAASVADVLALLFTAPQLLFFVEHGTDAVAEVARLSAYELASRLSYYYWRTAPDDALWAAAASGELLTAGGLKAQIVRLSASDRASPTWAEFFSQWFALEDLDELDGLVTTPAFKTLAGADLPGPDTREAAIADVEQMASWSVAHGASLSGLLHESRSFTGDPLLARLYGATPWASGAEPPMPASANRAGLLTRVAFLVSGSLNTRPILKGARIRNGLMCENLQLPAGNVAAVAPQPSPDATTRQVVEALTESSPNCAQCHQKLINPLGFSTEGFDALGRERQTELLFDAQGQRVGERPVDTRTVPALSSSDDPTVSTGPVDLTRLLDQSGRVHSCFARQYFRFVNRRLEQTTADGCALSELEQGALGGLSLAELFAKPTLRPEFSQRSFR